MMLDSTFINIRENVSTYDFPTIAGYVSQNQPTDHVCDGTFYFQFQIANTESRLIDELRTAYIHAKLVYQDLDSSRLISGFFEAKYLIECRLFGEELYPNISIDPDGEFIFSHKSKMGYVDIGVRGEKELSYHVRNDVNPNETRYDDYIWDDDYKIPKELYDALLSLKQQL